MAMININHGVKRLFRSQAFHYQALRTMGHTLGADPGECLLAIGTIRDKDPDSWYEGWQKIGKQCEEWAEKALDDQSKGQAYLRASNYCRSSEFFLHPCDARKIATYNKSAAMFVKGISSLKIQHEVWHVPYENASMRVYFFPGDAGKPLILVCGGYDSTNEESFFWIGQAAVARGYPCIMFEGPGQSNMIRQYNIKFTPAWERPVKSVLDYTEKQKPELASSKKILFGISLGGRLVPRAAACEKRIDALVIFGGAFYDAHRTALNQAPYIARLIYSLGLKKLFNLLSRVKVRHDIALNWAINNGCWTMEADNAYDLIKNFHLYNLDDYADDITCDVLLLHGENDHFYCEKDMLPFRNRLINARSFTMHTFRSNDGSAAHCQAGAIRQAELVFFDWIRRVCMAD
ncbi:MAG: hypothetical protein JXM72_09790 [Deltaproteobacteria bacterium]|nr:hypothetical protein [Deltaproteobacteria bacterium]